MTSAALPSLVGKLGAHRVLDEHAAGEDEPADAAEQTGSDGRRRECRTVAGPWGVREIAVFMMFPPWDVVLNWMKYPVT